MQDISEIEQLVKLISRLPGLGPKSARRIVLKLINNRDELMKPMANALAQSYKNVSRCKICGNLKSISLGCYNCEIINKTGDLVTYLPFSHCAAILKCSEFRNIFHFFVFTLAPWMK